MLSAPYSAPLRSTCSVIRAAHIKGSNLSFADKVEKIAAKGWKDETFCKTFLESLSLPKSLMPAQIVESAPQFILDPPLIPLKPLKDYQFGVFLEASRRLHTANARFVVQMPTGSGKTRTAMELATSYLNESQGRCVLVWLAHSDELCEQAHDGFVEVWRHLGRHPVRVARCWGSKATLPYDSREHERFVARERHS